MSEELRDRVALISDMVDNPEGAAEFVAEIVRFSKICAGEACHQVIDLIDGIMRHAKDRFRHDTTFTPLFASALYDLMNNLFPKIQSNRDYLDSFVEFLTGWKKDRLFEQCNFDLDYLLSQLGKYYPMGGGMPNSTCNTTSLYNQLVQRSYERSPAMTDTETSYGPFLNDNFYPNNQFSPLPPNRYPLQHVSRVEVQPFLPPQHSYSSAQKTPWLRKVILVNGMTTSPPMTELQEGHVTLYSSTIRVNGLPDSATENELKVRFKNFGIVYSITIVRDNTNRSALVCMKRHEDAKKAFNSFSKTLLLRKFFGSQITLEWKAGPGLIVLGNYRDYWNEDTGIAFVPHDFFKSEADLETIGESFIVDLNTLPSND